MALVGEHKDKSAYFLLLNDRIMQDLNPFVLTALQMLWENDIPSKVGVFGWRLLLEKLPTRAALASRGNGERLPQLVPDQILKLKQLTVLSSYTC
ncbi:hypothetical protein QL285_096925 [Trifolium repens]|nr:hypothetical protein QL285_096925 [Trifolium repens]